MNVYLLIDYDVDGYTLLDVCATWEAAERIRDQARISNPESQRALARIESWRVKE